MIVTKKPQIIDAKNGIEGIIYIRVANTGTLTAQGVVNSDVELFTLNYKEVELEKAVLDEKGNIKIGENGTPLTEMRKFLEPELVMIGKDKGEFKEETYFSKIGNIKSNEFDTTFIKQMEFVNKFDWSKSDKKPVRYWDLTAKDVITISDEEFAGLLKRKAL